MNASNWKKAAAFISEQNRSIARAPTQELDSLPLSTLSLDESSLPEVTYGAHMPLATSTPNSTAPHKQDPPLSDNYQQILPGVPQGSLYPTLAAMDLEQPNIAPTVIHTPSTRVITNMDKYMQDAKTQHQEEDNYFDAVTHSTNTSPIPDTVESTPAPSDQPQKDVQEKPQSPEQSKQSILESQKEDTGKTSAITEQDNNDVNTDNTKQSSSLSTIQEENQGSQIQHTTIKDMAPQAESGDDMDPEGTTEDTIIPVPHPNLDTSDTTPCLQL